MAKKVNKNYSIEIWGNRWARQSHAKYKNIVPEINSATLNHCNLLQKITPAPLAPLALTLYAQPVKRLLTSITYSLIAMTWNSSRLIYYKWQVTHYRCIMMKTSP